MKVCAVSFKECWRTPEGRWESYGGFPLQMQAISSIFEEMTLLIVEVPPRQGGMPLPDVRIVSMARPYGVDLQRKLSVAAHLVYYLDIMQRHIRQADIVHVPLPGDLPLLAMMVAVRLRKPIIARYCGAWTKTTETTAMNRVTRFAMRRLARRGNVMLATGLGDTPPAPGMDWIFASALSANELTSIQPDLQRGLSDPPRLGFIGRLSPEKGIENLLAAVEHIRARGRAPVPQVFLMGDGPLRKQLEDSILRRGLQDVVQMTGQLGRQALSEHLKKVDFCVQPSLSESLCKAWVDALAHGLPVVVSDVGAARAFIGTRCGWIVPPGDHLHLAETLETILTTPLDWSELRTRCLLHVQSLTIEHWAARIGTITAEKLDLSFSGARLERRFA